MAKLKEMSSLEGDPGGWAALNRMRRGDKLATPRALELFSTAQKLDFVGGPHHHNLQRRLMVLLSNSAQKSGLPQPPKASNDENQSGQSYFRRLYSYYRSWWQEHSENVVIHDPWLAELEKQKVD
jgi:hypothetical protein